MVHSAISTPSPTRSWKIAVVVLVISNLLLGGFSYHLLRKIDRTYTKLIVDAVPLLNALQAMTTQTVDTMRRSSSGLTSALPGERDSAVTNAIQAIASDRRLRSEALSLVWAPILHPARIELTAAGDAFGAAAAAVVEQFRLGRTAEAAQMRENLLRPAFDRYLVAASRAADLLEAESLRTSEAITTESSRMSAVVLSVASWPLLLGLGLGLIAVLAIAVLLLLLRGREMNESP